MRCKSFLAKFHDDIFCEKLFFDVCQGWVEEVVFCLPMKPPHFAAMYGISTAVSSMGGGQG
jgi:hypothetical protein